MLKKRIVLINPTNPEPPPNYFGPPYGLGLIAAALLKDGRDVLAYDFDLEPLEVMLSSIRGIIKRDKPRYIGICIQSCSRGSVYKLLSRIRQIDRSLTVILGGPFASIKYDLLLRNFPVDYVVIGDGERTLLELLNCLEKKEDLKKVNGLAFLSGRRLYLTPERRKVVDLDLLPYPAFHLFRDFDRKVNATGDKERAAVDFILGKRCASVKNSLLMLSSRGCIYSCNFCPMSGVFKDKIRFHSPKYFVDMVEYFHKKYGIRDFTFGDNTFTLVRKRVIEICGEIVERGLKIRWSCMTRADYVDGVLLEKMSGAGCFEVSYGIESGSEKIQRLIGKKLDLGKAKEAFRLTREAGMRSILMLMVGNVGESARTIKETRAFIKDLDPDNILVKIVKVYPGIKIHDIFEKKGLLKKDYYLTCDHHPPVFTVEHSEEELQELAEMIQPRITYIQAGSACNNNCLSCLLDKKQKDKSLQEVKNELALASTRGEQVVLFGGEPFLRKDIFEILDHAGKLDIHHFYIYSNARVFIYRKLAQAVNKTILRKMIIPFFGFTQEHDRSCRMEGAFLQAIEGIKNIKSFAPRIKIEAAVYICGPGLKTLAGLTHYLSNSGIDEFRFIFFRDSLGMVGAKGRLCPALSQAVRELKGVRKFLGQVNKPWRLEGIAPCAAGSFKDDLLEYRYPFNEVIGLDGKITGSSRIREREKEKMIFCKNCKESGSCEGIWKEYLRSYGRSEFKPI
ncbi:MAG: radical SAM protein [Candidatus Omnitrophica bacterium]|nr:radical SAM protein [Candidatus Omnitrophota bacterium]MDD5654059.1 radical SAM protein [Candidatus Omnitrophota bacterium]